MVVREYAHRRNEKDRQFNATETVYWHPVLVLPDGKGTWTFDVPDSASTFEAMTAAHTLDGRLGAATTEFPVRRRQP